MKAKLIGLGAAVAIAAVACAHDETNREPNTATHARSTQPVEHRAASTDHTDIDQSDTDDSAYADVERDGDDSMDPDLDRGEQSEPLTAGDQGESEEDLEITQQARKNVVAADGLSIKGKNVKIITVEGVVTLRGPVKSATEKSKIAAMVAKVEGVKRIDNQLEIAAQ